jgi:hypothetical protein
MGLVEDALEGGMPRVLLGLGVAVAAPIVLPAVANGVRPIAKTVIRGWLAAAAGVKGLTSKTREQMGDLVAEVRSEREGAEGAGAPAAGAVTAPPPKAPAKTGAKA